MYMNIYVYTYTIMYTWLILLNASDFYSPLCWWHPHNWCSNSHRFILAAFVKPHELTLKVTV